MADIAAGDRFIATAGWDHRVRLFDRRALERKHTLRPVAVLTGHTDAVGAVAVGTGDILASGGRDKRIRVYQGLFSD